MVKQSQKVSIAKAARLAGVSRTTIYRKINKDELSPSWGGIDTAELERVFGPLKPAEKAKETNNRKTEGLPPELIKQLSKAYRGETKIEKIKAIIDGAEDPPTIDDVLVSYWKEHGEVLERSTVISNLQKLVERKEVSRKKRRYYTTAHHLLTE